MSKTRYIVIADKPDGPDGTTVVRAIDTDTDAVISNEAVPAGATVAEVNAAKARARKVLDEQRPDWRKSEAYRDE